MPAQLQLTSANVTTPTGERAAVQIIVRRGEASLIEGKNSARNVVERRADVVAVERSSAKRGHWTIRFADGAEWAVVRIVRPCGCS